MITTKQLTLSAVLINHGVPFALVQLDGMIETMTDYTQRDASGRVHAFSQLDYVQATRKQVAAYLGY